MPFHWLLAVLVAVAIGAAASAWLWLARRRRDEADAGLAAIAGMRWREFSRFVLDAMRHRGHEVDADPVALAGARQTDFVMRRDGRKWLLACRHGEDAAVDLRAVRALENALLANGAAGGIFVTTGAVDAAARKAIAAQPKLQLLDDGALWRELSPMLPETLRDEAGFNASGLARSRIRLAWLGAIAVGVVVALFAGRAYSPSEPLPGPAVAAPPGDEPVPATPARRVPVPAADAAPDAVAASAQPPIAPAPIASTPEEEAFDRSQVALAISGLPGIADATWVTDSTLLVDLRSDADERWAEICAILEDYETLRTSRLQLQPAPGSNEPVRFRQCRVF